MGARGTIAKQWLKAETKLALLTVTESSQPQGVSARRSCSILLIEQRGGGRWQQRTRQGQGLDDLVPGPQAPWHRMLPAAIERIVALAKRPEYVDLSHRILAVTAGEKGLFQASFSTIYRVLKDQGLMTARDPGGPPNGNSKAPVRKDLTGPNPRWGWDISYLMSPQQGGYIYRYLRLDEWSRKAVQWRVAWQQTAAAARLLLEAAWPIKTSWTCLRTSVPKSSTTAVAR